MPRSSAPCIALSALLLLGGCSKSINITNHTGVPNAAADSGLAPDAAPSPDGGGSPDGGSPIDAGAPLDGGETVDSGGAPPDTGIAHDTGASIDAGGVSDSGAPSDTGASPDAAAPDAEPPDAGPPDASASDATADAGSPVDAGAGCVVSSEAAWSGGTAAFTFAGPSVAHAGSNNGAIASSSTLSWDGDLTVTTRAAATSTFFLNFGLYPAAEHASFDPASAYGGVETMTAGFWLDGQSTGRLFHRDGTMTVSGPTHGGITSAETWRFERRGGIVRVLRGGALFHQFTIASTGDLRAFIGHHNRASADALDGVTLCD